MTVFCGSKGTTNKVYGEKVAGTFDTCLDSDFHCVGSWGEGKLAMLTRKSLLRKTNFLVC